MTSDLIRQVREALEYAELVWSRYRDHGDAADLSAAIGTWRRILGSSQVSDRLPHEAQSARAGLALALIDAHARSGETRYLSESIELSDTALRIEPPEGDGRLALLNTRHVALLKRFDAERRPADLRAAEDALDQMVRVAPDDLAAMVNRANLLMLRFDVTGSLETLDEAIVHCKRCVARVSLEHRPAALGSLAGALIERYAARGREVDIERAYEAQQQAIAMLATDSPLRAEHLAILGSILLTRYDASKAVQLLNAAIETFDKAMPMDVAVQPPRTLLQNAGYARILRFAHHNDERDLEKGIALTQLADARRGDDERPAPGLMANLGIGFAARYRLHHGDHDLDRARACFRACLAEALANDPQAALHAALNWGALESELQDWSTAHEAYQQGLDAAQMLFEASSARESQKTWLYWSRDLGPRAAYAAARAGELRAAVLALERSRAVLWSSALRLGSADLGALEATDPTLAQRLRTASARCARRSSDNDADARLELAAVIAEVRKRPGLERWLARVRFEDITSAAKDEPLVYLAAADAGGLALIVSMVGSSAQIATLWLPDLTDKAVRERLRGLDGSETVGGYLGAYQAWQRSTPDERERTTADWSSALDEAMCWCWNVAVGQVCDALPASDRVVLIAAGALGYFPLHAAWTTDCTLPGGRRYALDRMSFAYAPNATVYALAKEAACERAADEVLAIENPAGPSEKHLPGAAFEVRCATRRFAHSTILRGTHADRPTVARALPQAAVAHFCCHASADMADPLESGLQLAGGGRLTLREMLESRLPRCRLVILSACETALAGTQLPDEALSLQSGMLQAGAAATIATLWAVYDTSATMVAARFYAEWRGEPARAPCEALAGAQQWVRDSTNQEKLDWFRRDADTALLPAGFFDELERAIAVDGPTGRSYAGLLHWAGFNYAGA